jgi:nickel/cobalt exporter
MVAGARRSTRGRWRRYAVPGAILLGLLLALWCGERGAAAHPLGNFTINSYSRLDFAAGAVRVTYIVDYAEIPTFQLMPRLDPDGDGTLDAAESAAFLDGTLPDLVRGLQLTIGGRPLALTTRERTAGLVPGQGGLLTLRVEAHLDGAPPPDWSTGGAARYTDGNFGDRLGWREVVVRGGAGIAIDGDAALAEDRSDELRSYPQDLLTTPLNRREATFTLRPAPGTAPSNAGASVAPGQRGPIGGLTTSRVAGLAQAEQLTPGTILLAILGAIFWGALHALSPGHGKTVVAAYLIGTRGTARHAAFLGLTVTITHTLGVFALGAVTLWLARVLLPETLYPWLNALSGVAVVVIGATLAWQRLRGAGGMVPVHEHTDDAQAGLLHTHGGRAHMHLPPGATGERVTRRSLLALGVSGGLIPCPSALVLLLGAIALGRTGFGLLLVLAFSVGLASVLTAIGLLCVHARRLFGRLSFEPRVPRLLPVASALAITLAGLAIVIDALRQGGIV